MTSPKKGKKTSKPQFKYGIGEWYGKSFITLQDHERKALAEIQKMPKKHRPPQPCPFQSQSGKIVACNKEGGVCSLRMYERAPDTGEVRVALGSLGRLSTTCPNRFEEGRTIYHWVGETMLGCGDPLVIGEIGFLEHPRLVTGSDEETEVGDDIRRIQGVLVPPGPRTLSWIVM